MSIVTLILYLSFLVNFSILFPTEHQLTTYGVNNASTSQLTAKSNTWSTSKIQSSITCTCSINTTNSWIKYPVNVPAESVCNLKAKENCFQACDSMLDRTIFNVQSESVYSTNITDGVDFSDYLCGLKAKGEPLPFVVVTSKMKCINEHSRISYKTSSYISLPIDYYCRQIENSNVNSTIEITESTIIH